MTAQAFAEKLRRQRERRGISLPAIADETKIGRRLLADLERGDCSRWPAGIYARSYARAYAESIGLDPAEVVADFCEHFPQFAPEPLVEPTEAAPADPPIASARRRWFAQLRDFVRRADSRLDLFFGIERSD